MLGIQQDLRNSFHDAKRQNHNCTNNPLELVSESILARLAKIQINTSRSAKQWHRIAEIEAAVEMSHQLNTLAKYSQLIEAEHISEKKSPSAV